MYMYILVQLEPQVGKGERVTTFPPPPSPPPSLLLQTCRCMYRDSRHLTATLSSLQTTYMYHTHWAGLWLNSQLFDVLARDEGLRTL